MIILKDTNVLEEAQKRISFLFDEFEKEGRVSYAFSVVFQSQDRTLTDLEVDVDMKKITLVLQELGCEVR